MPPYCINRPQWSNASNTATQKQPWPTWICSSWSNKWKALILIAYSCWWVIMPFYYIQTSFSFQSWNYKCFEILSLIYTDDTSIHHDIILHISQQVTMAGVQCEKFYHDLIHWIQNETWDLWLQVCKSLWQLTQRPNNSSASQGTANSLCYHPC